MRKVNAGKPLVGSLAIIGLATLAGCESFSPPPVNLEYRIADAGSPSATSASRMPPGVFTDTACAKLSPSGQIAENTVDGALRLIDNFAYVYRCTASNKANKRQRYELLTILAGSGTAIAAAFGGGADVAIAGGSAVALLSGVKGYYSPQTQASYYIHALDAIHCIGNEAVGVPSFAQLAPDVQSLRLGRLPGPTVSPEVRYYHLVKDALLEVELIVRQRLNGTGTSDPAGIIAQIKVLQDQAAKAEAKKAGDTVTVPAVAGAVVAPGAAATPAAAGATNAPATPQVPAAAAPPAQVGTTVSPPPMQTPAPTAVQALASPQAIPLGAGESTDTSVGSVAIDLDVLQPKLQQCVVRAKI